MKATRNLTEIWKNVQEFDLRPIRDDAEQEIKIALAGKPGVGRNTLASQMRSEPLRPASSTRTPILVADLSTAQSISEVDLIILLVDARDQELSQEQACLDRWLATGERILVFFNKTDLLPEENVILPELQTGFTPVIYGTAIDREFLVSELAPELMKLLPNCHLALGRQFPLLRIPIARNLINQTSSANAVWAISTGIAEMVPVLNLPLNLADIVVHTKAQALLVYKLGLTFGLPTDWQFYVAEFGSVIGGGFLWRQIARQLVGLIPVWGIVPKVAVAYSGTYVVGQAVLHWYQTGRHLSKKKMRQLSRSAARRGKSLAQHLRRKKAETEEGERPTLPEATSRECPLCQTENDVDARYCKHCAQPLAEPGPESSD